jgi:transcriptional regulator with XRE-family HTH domain
MSSCNELASVFGSRLRAAREAKELSQEALFRISGIHRTQISDLESGVRAPRLDTLLILCSVLDTGVGELLAGIKWHPGPALGPRQLRGKDEGEWKID